MQPEPDTRVLSPRGRASLAPREPATTRDDPPAGRSVSGPIPVTRRVGRYELIHRIAHGGMATVYLGRAKGKAGFEKVVAVKVIHPHLASEAEFVAMFLDEARIAARLHHPHVVETLDLGESDGAYYMVMEFIEGENLAALIRATKREKLPLSVVLQLLADTLDGLGAAHELCNVDGLPYRLVHRDVSPHNILINLDGWAKVGDFGIMKAAGKTSNTKTGELRGKLAYMSPEQARGTNLDLRTDLFAVGVIGWELVTGRRLFARETEALTLERVMAGEIPPIDRGPEGDRPELGEPAASELAEGLQALLVRALAAAPDDRFGSAAEMLAEVKRLRRLSEALDGGTPEPRAYLSALMKRLFRKRVDYARAALRRTGEHEALGLGSDDFSRAAWTVEPTLQVGRSQTGSRPGAAGSGSGLSRVVPTGSLPFARDPISAEVGNLPGPEQGLPGPSGSLPTLAGNVGEPMRWLLLVLLPMLGAALAVGVIWVLDPFEPKSEPAPIQVAPAEPGTPRFKPAVDYSLPPTGTTVAREVRWHFSTTPVGASVIIDDELWPQVTPTTVLVPSTGEAVEVRLELDGYTSKLLRLVPLSDQTFDRELTLEPEPEPSGVKTGPKTGSRPHKNKPSDKPGRPDPNEKKFLPPPDSLRGRDGE